MRKTGFISAIIALVLVSGCAVPVEVKYAHDPWYNYSNLKTYDWLPMESAAMTRDKGINQFKDAVNRELVSKGMVMTDDNPDFLISLNLFSQMRFGFQEPGIQYLGEAFGWRHIKGGINLSSKGGIFLDFVDAETEELFWHGEASGSLKPNLTPEKQEREYAKVAARLLKKFPPSGN